jgi:hypothetical protein
MLVALLSAAATAASNVNATLLVLTSNASVIGLHELDLRTGAVVSSVPISLPKSVCHSLPSEPCWMLQNNGYDFAIAPDGEAVYFLNQFVNVHHSPTWESSTQCAAWKEPCPSGSLCCQDPAEGPNSSACFTVSNCSSMHTGKATTIYSPPQLLHVSRRTGTAKIVAEVAQYNLQELTAANYHLGVAGKSGDLLAVYRHYEDPKDSLSNQTIGLVRIDPTSGAVGDLGPMVWECPACEGAYKGRAVTSELGAFAVAGGNGGEEGEAEEQGSSGGAFCDESDYILSGAPVHFRQLVCWSLDASRAPRASPRSPFSSSSSSSLRVTTNVSNAVQLMSSAYDAQSKRVVGLGLCCTQDGCPTECVGRANNRTWVVWDPTVAGAQPEVVRLIDPLSGPYAGPTYTTLGSAVQPSARVFTYVAINPSTDQAGTRTSFITLDVDTGEPLGATPWPAASLGEIYRFAFAP